MSIYKWVKSPVFPNEYLVSENGDVKSLRTGKILKPTKDRHGYLYYVLCVNGERRTVKAHRLVAGAFIENPLNKPCIDHINGNRTDNRANNLRWVTCKENTNNPLTREKVIKRAMEKIPSLIEISKVRGFGREKTAVFKDGELLGIFDSQRLAACFSGVSEGKVSQCVSGKKKSCNGYVFERVED